MSVFVIIALIFSWQANANWQPNKEEEFQKTLRAVVTGFSNQDSVALGKLLNKKVGLYQLHRIGVFDHYNHFRSISFADEYPTALFRSAKGVRLMPLKYETLPTYDCSKEWSKTGLYVDTTKTDHLVSTICKERNKNVPDSIPDKTIQYFYNLEKNSRRIVLSDQRKRELVFYLTYLDGKWYLTIVDNVTSDCSV